MMVFRDIEICNFIFQDHFYFLEILNIFASWEKNNLQNIILGTSNSSRNFIADYTSYLKMRLFDDFI